MSELAFALFVAGGVGFVIGVAFCNILDALYGGFDDE